MKFTVSLKDKRLKSLFRFAGDYIDVWIGEHAAIFFAGMSDLFTMATLSVNTMEEYDSTITSFRIPKSGFFSLLEEGVISFLCADEAVYVNFDNGSVARTMRFDRQICSDPGLDEKLKIVRDAPDYPVFAVHRLIMPAKLLKNSFEAISITNNIAFADLSGLQLYAKMKENKSDPDFPDCALFPFPLTHLITVCDGDFENVRAVRDYIVYSDGIYHVLLNKVSSRSESDIRYIMKQPTVYKVKVDFSQALSLLAKIKDFSDVDLNLRRQELILISKGCEYSTKIQLIYDDVETPMSLEDLLNEKQVEVPQIRFPAEVFKNIIYAVKAKSLDIVCTAKLVRVSVQRGLMFVCKKELAT